MTSKKTMWHTVCQDAGDGSGDLVIELPEDLLADLGWKTGDTLSFDIKADRSIVLSKAASCGEDGRSG